MLEKIISFNQKTKKHKELTLLPTNPKNQEGKNEKKTLLRMSVLIHKDQIFTKKTQYNYLVLIGDYITQKPRKKNQTKPLFSHYLTLQHFLNKSSITLIIQHLNLRDL